jgi:hypothetical protein
VGVRLATSPVLCAQAAEQALHAPPDGQRGQRHQRQRKAAQLVGETVRNILAVGDRFGYLYLQLAAIAPAGVDALAAVSPSSQRMPLWACGQIGWSGAPGFAYSSRP